MNLSGSFCEMVLFPEVWVEQCSFCSLDMTGLFFGLVEHCSLWGIEMTGMFLIQVEQCFSFVGYNGKSCSACMD